jgi:transcriptional regulator with XRE-family HTH domain
VKYLRNEKVIKALGKKIRSVRQEKNMSMEELAYSTGIEYSQLSRIELGQVNTSVSHVAAIAETLKISISRLFDFDV